MGWILIAINQYILFKPILLRCDFTNYFSLFFSRFIVLRRLCLLLGLLYGYRAITMFVTVLPISNPNYQCDPKLTESGQYLTVLIVLKRAVKILSGFGLSMNGQHVFCGDFIFSGHTMIFLLCYLVIVECKNSKFSYVFSLRRQASSA